MKAIIEDISNLILIIKKSPFINSTFEFFVLSTIRRLTSVKLHVKFHKIDTSNYLERSSTKGLIIQEKK